MKKTGLLLMFIGIVLIGIFMLSDLQISFTAWLIGYILSMVFTGAGIIVLIVYLAKGILAEKRSKMK